MSDTLLLEAHGVAKTFGRVRAVRNVSLRLCEGQSLAIVGESGSGKSTLLSILAGQLKPDVGSIRYLSQEGWVHLEALEERHRRKLARTEWGFVRQHAQATLRPRVSAGGHVGERLMGQGARHYGQIRARAQEWMARVEMDPSRVDHLPSTFSGGMQQRLQLISNLITHPRLVLLDEPTTGLDVSVQARLLDLLRGLQADLGLAMILVTHDLGVARLLADQVMVMLSGEVVEQGLTDQVFDDPQHAYTQQLVASIL
ncbi:MAG: phosphonate C-P lyase system protein PhnK [Betaproteobacteria bacterium]|nr:phosphonate C-P lyase system protein PhnK [Betaproteobacteria bacterium]